MNGPSCMAALESATATPAPVPERPTTLNLSTSSVNIPIMVPSQGQTFPVNQSKETESSEAVAKSPRALRIVNIRQKFGAAANQDSHRISVPASEDQAPHFFLPPKLVKSHELYQDYYEQEADHFCSSRGEKGVAPCIPPTGRDITDPKKWIGIPMTNRDRLSYAWGAASAYNPYCIAALLGEGASLGTAISHTLHGVEPAVGLSLLYTNPPVWPAHGFAHVLVGQNSRAMPTTMDLQDDMDQSEIAIFPGQMRATDVHLAQSCKLRVRTYKKKMDDPLTQAGTSTEGAI